MKEKNVKKGILGFSMVLALTVVMALPMAASAETGGTVISGTLANTATLIVPDNITFTTFTVGTNTGSSAYAGSVVANVAGWSLAVSDTKSSYKGYMRKSDGTNLADQIQVGMTAGTVTTIPLYEAQLKAATVSGYGAAGTFSIPLYVSQTVVPEAKGGTYTITLTYVATPADP
jgi:hypothetical protein